MAKTLEQIYLEKPTISGDVKAPTVRNYFVDTYEDTPIGAYARKWGGIVGSSAIFGCSFTDAAMLYAKINKNFTAELYGKI